MNIQNAYVHGATIWIEAGDMIADSVLVDTVVWARGGEIARNRLHNSEVRFENAGRMGMYRDEDRTPPPPLPRHRETPIRFADLLQENQS